MGASEIKQRAFMLTHGRGEVKSNNKEVHIWKYACLAFPNSDDLCYEFPNGAVMYLSKDDFHKMYNDTAGETIVLFYDNHRVANTDVTLDFDEFSYMRLKGQGFNPKWQYCDDSDKYLMHNGNDVVSELFVNKEII